MQVGIYRKVAQRFGHIMLRGLQSAWQQWWGLVVTTRAANNAALTYFRRWVKDLGLRLGVSKGLGLA
jgi:hypothetical protein